MDHGVLKAILFKKRLCTNNTFLGNFPEFYGACSKHQIISQVFLAHRTSVQEEKQDKRHEIISVFKSVHIIINL